MSQENSDFPPPPPPKTRGKISIQVIALAVVCIVLAASLVAVFAVYQPTTLQGQLNDKKKEVTSLQAQIASLTAQFNSNATSYQNQITSLNTQLASLTDQLNSASAQLSDAADIMNMTASRTLVDNAAKTFTNYTDVFTNSIPYPGYVVVQATSNSTSTYAQVFYSAFGVNYNQNVTVGKSGTAAFPVLPTSTTIRIGASDLTAVNATVTVTYHY